MRGAPGAGAATRERVQAVAAELGYRPDQRARLLRSGRPQVLGVTFQVQQPFHGDVVESVYRHAEAAGYDVVLSAVAPSRAEQRAVESLLRERCDALLLVGATSRVPVVVDWAAQLPVVVIARRMPAGSVDSVSSADEAGATLAVDHLVELGHVDIVHVDGGRSPSSADRRRGYRKAMQSRQFDEFARVFPGGSTEEAGAAAMRAVLNTGRTPTAVTVFNDHGALGVTEVIREAGLGVPRDISVVGYDNTAISALSTVNLTTVDQNIDQLAGLAVQRAIGLLGQADAPRASVIDPHLVIRATTAPPRL